MASILLENELDGFICTCEILLCPCVIYFLTLISWCFFSETGLGTLGDDKIEIWPLSHHTPWLPRANHQQTSHRSGTSTNNEKTRANLHRPMRNRWAQFHLNNTHIFISSDISYRVISPLDVKREIASPLEWLLRTWNMLTCRIHSWHWWYLG